MNEYDSSDCPVSVVIVVVVFGIAVVNFFAFTTSLNSLDGYASVC